MPPHQSTSSPYPSLIREPLKSGSSSDVGLLRCLRVRTSCKDQQATQTKTLLKGNALTVFEQAEIA
eukprot:2863831-Ditylum_brightwellii.AAC.1